MAALVAGRRAASRSSPTCRARTSSTSSPQDGSGKPEALTTGGQAFRYAPAWSPDGTRIAFGDKDGRVYVVTVADKTITRIVDAPRGQIQDYTWAPRGHHLAFSMNGANGFSSVHIWSEKDGQVRRVTDPLFNAETPGLGSRRQVPLLHAATASSRRSCRRVEFNFATNRTTGIFALALRKDVAHPFPPESDEVKIADETKDEPKADEKKPARRRRGGSRRDKDATPRTRRRRCRRRRAAS